MSNAPDQVALQGKRRWIALLFLALGVSMIILDATVVNVAIPTMVRDLNLTTNEAEWVNAAYSLTFASLLIFFGRLADRFGRKRLFIIGVIVFVLASVLVASSNDSISLIAARALQGIGGAMILPSSLSVINAVFVGKARAVAFAAWGGTIGGMAALGPLVGGWLTTYYSWHWAFLINVPIGVIVLIGVVLVVPETRDALGRKGIDLVGTVLVTIGLLGIVFALIEGQRYGWLVPTEQFSIGSWTWPSDSISVVPVAGILGILSIVAMLFIENARAQAGKVVVLDLRLFRIRSFGAGNAVAVIVSLGEFGLLFAIPLFLQATRGYDALQTGVILLALALGSFAASGLGAALSQRFGPVRVLQLGMVLEVIGIFGLGLMLSTTITGWQMAPWLFIYGMGVGFATAQLTGVILSEVPVEESGTASAVQSTSRQVGAAIGTAIIGTTLIIGLGTTTTELEDRGVPTEQAQQIGDAVAGSAGQAIPALAQQPDGDVLVEAASQGFANAIKSVAWVAGALVFLGLLTSLTLPKNTARVESEGYESPTESEEGSASP
ncbi:MAG: MFS transporter [Candidatus Nanopelagicales bacterium]|jgi:EmrB/QacA subfamily drug resistance transporter|nr:MFS transporter [Candidatus Nanopelagicales bacterium]NKB94382.1 DHA2 family efflux MFS transporter permease subunit [Candidatus Nanopelagicales bacterium]